MVLKTNKEAIYLDDNKVQELLLQIVQDVSWIKAKIEVIENLEGEHKDNLKRIEQLESQCREHDRVVKSLEKRCNTVEQVLRQNMDSQGKMGWKIIGSMAACIFSAIVSVIVAMF